jgi:integrase
LLGGLNLREVWAFRHIALVLAQRQIKVRSNRRLARIVSHLNILALGRDQTKTVVVDGERREVSGRGDPQAMRAFLLEVLTGRRINEILLMDPEPLIPLPGLDAQSDSDPEAFVARLRYRQSQISGAPDTILVEREVVNIVREQQHWLQEHLATMNPTSPPAPRYLFVAWKSNRKGTQPYSAHTLRDRLHGLATELQIRDEHGRLIDFQRTHRMRHTKATELLNRGVPIHVVQRYLQHLSPEMTMRYADTAPKTHEREFLHFKKLGRDDRELGEELIGGSLALALQPHTTHPRAWSPTSVRYRWPLRHATSSIEISNRSLSRSSSPRCSSATRSMIRPTVCQSILVSRQAAVLSVFVASHATRLSKSRVNRAPSRANGTPSTSARDHNPIGLEANLPDPHPGQVKQASECARDAHRRRPPSSDHLTGRTYGLNLCASPDPCTEPRNQRTKPQTSGSGSEISVVCRQVFSA